MSERIIIDVIGPGLGFFSSIGCLVVLNTFLKELHTQLKHLLNILFIHNAITLGISCALSGGEGELYCFGRYFTMLPAFSLTMTSMPMLSYMRYYITMKTQNTEAIDEKWLHKIIILAYLGKYRFLDQDTSF